MTPRGTPNRWSTVAVAKAVLLMGCSGGDSGSEVAVVDQGDCPQYLDCVNELDRWVLPLRATYGENGTCWIEQSPRSCRAACTSALASLRAQAGPGDAPCYADRAEHTGGSRP